MKIYKLKSGEDLIKVILKPNLEPGDNGPKVVETHTWDDRVITATFFGLQAELVDDRKDSKNECPLKKEDIFTYVEHLLEGGESFVVTYITPDDTYSLRWEISKTGK